MALPSYTEFELFIILALMTHDFYGFHGTSFLTGKKIIEGDFQISKGDEEWVGDGVYFFMAGLSSKPEEQAKEWAIAQSWDKVNSEYKYKKYCVIKSEISVSDDSFLDLTTEDGIEVLNYFIERFEEKINSIGKRLKFIDGLVLNLARQEGILKLDVVKGNFYIKFTVNRLKRINLRTSNCTICSVYEPKHNIRKSSILSLGEITI